MSQGSERGGDSASADSSGGRWFLLAFDPRISRLLSLEDFEQDQTAVEQAYASLRGEYESHTAVEVTILRAESIEALRVTHARYFEPAQRLAVPKRRSGKEITL